MPFCCVCVFTWWIRHRLAKGSLDWQKEAALSQHTDWVRDVAWAPTTGVPCNTLATCSEVHPHGCTKHSLIIALLLFGPGPHRVCVDARSSRFTVEATASSGLWWSRLATQLVYHRECTGGKRVHLHSMLLSCVSFLNTVFYIYIRAYRGTVRFHLGIMVLLCGKKPLNRNGCQYFTTQLLLLHCSGFKVSFTLLLLLFCFSRVSSVVEGGDASQELKQQ
jgi:hypothetical protein